MAIRRVTVDDRLARLCGDFSVAKIGEWLERKFPSYDTSKADLISIAENKNDKEYFKGARLLGYVRDLPERTAGAAVGATRGDEINRPLLVAAVEMRKILTERTSRQAQFSFAKRVLQNAVRSGAAGLNGYPSQGLFFFYDADGFFRISLVSGEMDGRKFKFNEAKRQSFYIDPNRPNNVAKARLSEPLETYSKLKDAFSVETLTKEFYGKLFDWYEWALKPKTGVTFPNDDSTPDDDCKYNNESIIRLITRLMFTWFIRQRDMVQKELFSVEDVGTLLKKFDPKSMEDDNYYRCVLQNLFFATFNCQPEKRGFIRHKSGNFSCYSDQHNVKTLYRYEKEFRDHDAFKELLKKTPFLNCALFDCLDKQEREEDGGRLLLFDGFSDNRKRQAHVPNGLFFHPEKGIIPLFDTYEFTIDENNADDADVALDPELLGKVFENLLGAFNPETKETARNATGSFYTPREIVDYMVEESLKNYLKAKLKDIGDGRARAPREPEVNEWLNDLFDKAAAAEKRELPFDDEVAAKIREALYNCKILDPACGSGAFPMGILHCMVRLFGRLDPSNIDLNRRLIMRYKQEINQQRDPSYTESEWQERQEQLKVQLAEGQHYPDYARKLYLIENCIYGVDIQPIATQISKLRFFISLLCDQMRELCAEGGARQDPFLALPNLEAKFVCANTLIALPKTEGELELMSSSKIPRLREKLQENRHRIFAARTFRQKEKLKDRDLSIRDEIRETVRSTLAKPDKELIKVQEEIIAKLQKDRVVFEQPKMVKQQKAVQGDFFAATQSTLSFEMVDANKLKRDQIDTQIEFAQRKINSELAKSSATNVTKIDQLAALVAGWDPYDQNASSSFFDPEWMFNLKDGFDIVIGNPPYVQLQANGGELAKMYQDCGYETFDRTGDLYCLFYERGWQLLNESGDLCYITSDKWMRNDYGQPLRNFFLTKTDCRILIDITGQQVFESAVVEANIMLFGKQNRDVCEPMVFDFKTPMKSIMSTSFRLQLFACKFESSKSWVIQSLSEKNIFKKISTSGTPIRDWNLRINYGIKTGLNEAFVINETTKDSICAACPSASQIMLPVLRGRNVNRYGACRADRWLIATHNGYRSTKRVAVSKYPAVVHWLKKFEPKLSKRSDQGQTPFNLRACDYWDDFHKQKIVWIELSDTAKFTLWSGCILDTCSFIVGDSLPYVLGVLNSKLAAWYFGFLGTRSGMGTLRWKKFMIEQLPVVCPNPDDECLVSVLVDRILAAKQKDPNADTSALESQIDRLVYKLYGLTEEEIAVVEGKTTDARGASDEARVVGVSGETRIDGASGGRSCRGVRRARPAMAASAAEEDSEVLD